MTTWEYCILTRLSAELDTKWYVNRVYQHHENSLPEEVTDERYREYNQRLDELHASKVYPVLPAALNLLGADGWELIDDMNTGMAGGEGLVFKREIEGGARPRRAAGKTSARKAAAKKSSAKKASARIRR